LREPACRCFHHVALAAATHCHLVEREHCAALLVLADGARDDRLFAGELRAERSDLRFERSAFASERELLPLRFFVQRDAFGAFAAFLLHPCRAGQHSARPM
jgi:hypothetical protein